MFEPTLGARSALVLLELRDTAELPIAHVRDYFVPRSNQVGEFLKSSNRVIIAWAEIE